MNARIALVIGPVGRPELVGTFDDVDLAAEVASRLLADADRAPAMSPMERGRRETLREISAMRRRPRLRVLPLDPAARGVTA